MLIVLVHNIIKYNVKDLSSNSAIEVTRTVTVTDANKPVITLLGDTVMDHLAGTPFVDPGYTAFDNEDGDLTSSVVATFDNNGDQYLLSYNVTDSAGNAAEQKQRKVNVVTPTIIDIEAENSHNWRERHLSQQPTQVSPVLVI